MNHGTAYLCEFHIGAAALVAQSGKSVVESDAVLAGEHSLGLFDDHSTV